MDITLDRVIDTDEATVGILQTSKHRCFIIEDQYQETKVSGETRIGTGPYRILLRDEGGMNNRYRRKFPDIHVGMLHLQKVSGFKWIYIHIGNKDDDTLGCLLTNSMVNLETMIGRDSTSIYLAIYKELIAILLSDEGLPEHEQEQVWIYITDRILNDKVKI